MDNFVTMMNKKAKDLGLTSTSFVNPYGLDADGHFSSARDMAIMARELIKHEIILRYSSIYEEYLNKPDGSNIWMVNTNKLVRFYSGVDGLKTGFTSKAGYCLTATGKWNDMRLISVVMGEENQNNRTDDTVALLNYGKSSFKLNTILSKDEVVGEVEIELGQEIKNDVIIMDDVVDLVNVQDDEINYTYDYTTYKLVAPVKKGEKIGNLNVYYNGKKEMSYYLTVKEDVKKCTIFTLLKRVLSKVILGN